MAEEKNEQAQTTVPIDASGFSMSMECFDRFTKNFEASARRWELIVYPSLFAFIVLAAYGFFLVYHLTSDIATLARNVSKLTLSVDRMVTNMDSMNSTMNAMALNINEMSKNTHTMTGYMENISSEVNALTPMQANMQSMDQSTRAMSIYADQMRHSMRSLNYGVHQTTAPAQMMNSFVPFW